MNDCHSYLWAIFNGPWQITGWIRVGSLLSFLPCWCERTFWKASGDVEGLFKLKRGFHEITILWLRLRLPVICDFSADHLCFRWLWLLARLWFKVWFFAYVLGACLLWLWWWVLVFPLKHVIVILGLLTNEMFIYLLIPKAPWPGTQFACVQKFEHLVKVSGASLVLQLLTNLETTEGK